jgi:Domain of unknown function DUF11
MLPLPNNDRRENVAVRRRRLLRVPVSLITCLSLVLLGVAPVAGASSMSVNIVSSPTLVTRGEPVSYVIELQNTGSNSINHTTLEADTPTGFTYRRALTTKGSCNAAPAADPLCDLGQFSAGTPALVVLIFDTSPSASLGSFDFVVTVRGGEGGNDQPHAAHLDTFTDKTETIVLAVNQDFTTHYIVPEGDSITTGGLLGAIALSATNPQGTMATVPNTPFGVPAAVSEVGGPDDFCPPAFADDCFGQASAVSVGNGMVLSPYLVVQVRFDYPTIKTLNERRLGIIHWFDPYPTAGFEEITRICSDATPTDAELPCRLPVQTMPDRDWLVTIYMESNGYIKGKG